MLDIQEWRALVSMPGEGGRIRVSIFSHTGFKTLAIPGWWGHPLWKHLGLADVFPFFQTYRRHSQFQPTSYVRSAGKSTKFGVFRIVECVLQFRSSRVELFLISNFRRVLNVLCFLPGNSPASEFCVCVCVWCGVCVCVCARARVCGCILVKYTCTINCTAMFTAFWQIYDENYFLIHHLKYVRL